MKASTTSAAGATHVGRVRQNNEDAYAVTDDLWVVADGLGGHAGGEVASRAAVDAAVAALSGAADADAHGAVRRAFGAAHAAILEIATRRPGLYDMGTTLVLAWRQADGTIRIGNVGDSRAYLLDCGELIQITTDDNHAEDLVRQGLLTRDQARVHPGQYWITKALGLGDPKAPFPSQNVLTPSGRLLLCTDGLNGELTDAQIAGTLGRGTPQEAADALVDQAVAAGGSDNVTVVVVDLEA